MRYQQIIGIDVSKDTFDYARWCVQSGRQVAGGTIKMTHKGIRTFIKRECQLGPTQVVMEATGNYHLRLQNRLADNDIDYSVVNPLVIKRFADMKMKRGKSDKADARLIMRFGYEQKPACSIPPSAKQQALKSITTALEGLVKQQTQLKNSLHAQELVPNPNKAVIRSLKTLLRQIAVQIKKLEDERLAIIMATDPETYELVRSVVGIGPKTGAGICARLGDLSQFETANQINAMIGINPMPRQSGTSLKSDKGISKQGNKSLRTLFYLAALSACKHNLACAQLYQRLIKKGKHRKTALIAVANKLVKQIFAVVKSKTMFDNEYHLKFQKNLDF